MKSIPRLAQLCAAPALAALFFCAAAAAQANAQAKHRAAKPDEVCRSAFDGDEALKKAKANPFHMVTFGDSIMWGQGLKDRDKFWCRVKQWVELKTGRQVLVHPYAHAGAVIKHSDPECPPKHYIDESRLEGPTKPGGEVNVGFPTINDQVTRAVAEMKADGGRRAGPGREGAKPAPDEVDLVLVDGCINDVNFRTFLDPRNGEGYIRRLTEARCGEPMELLLNRVTGEFRNAYVVVTGYYPIIFKGVQEGNKKVVKGSANNPIMRLALERLNKDRVPCPSRDGETCLKDDWSCLDDLSRTWYETSNRALTDAVAKANRYAEGERAGPPAPAPARVHFAELHFPPDYGFSTKQSMLWSLRLNSTGVGGLKKFLIVVLDGLRSIETNDDRWDVRGDQCKRALKDFKPRLKELEGKKEINRDQREWLMDGFLETCRRGSIGHPNKFGALLYAQAITARLQTILTPAGWPEPAAAAGGVVQPQR